MSMICHMTSAHGPEDVRIFHKECVSLAKSGHDVYLVQQGEKNEKNGVHLVGVGYPSGGRLTRMSAFSKKVYEVALRIDADVYHFHDPELIPYGLKLKRKGKHVIFDSHEDFPADIAKKRWIPQLFRPLIAKAYKCYEEYCDSKFDATISVSPKICERLRKCSKKNVMITNYPIWTDVQPQTTDKSRSVVFTGGASRQWSIDAIVSAVAKVEDVTFELRTKGIQAEYLSELKQNPGWEKVNWPGAIPHHEVLPTVASCTCGMALLNPAFSVSGKRGTLGNTKIYEYMMAGVPVICSNLVIWEELIDKYKCGICVDPANVNEIATAIRYLLDHPEEAKQMGENGRRAVKEEFNWGVEEKKLFALYEDILKD